MFILLPRSQPWKAEPPSKYYCNCGRLPFHAPSHAFFLDMIGEIYDRNASLSIYQKKKIYLPLCVVCNSAIYSELQNVLAGVGIGILECEYGTSPVLK